MVELVYIGRDGQWRFHAPHVPGQTAADLLAASGVLDRFPELQGTAPSLGIFGKRCTGDAVLREGDRVEVYRPLINDPKKARRDRAARTS